MQCPICGVELKMAERQGVEIDFCPQCRGVWLDRGELDKIIERTIGVDPRHVGVNHHDDDDYDEYRPSYDGRTEREVPHGYDNDSEDAYRAYPAGKRKRGGFLGELFDIFGGDD